MIPVILSGGSGSRLWPLSRKQFPKQFLALTGDQTLFQQTLGRLVFDGMQDPVVVCNKDHRFIVNEQLAALDLDTHAIIMEPFGRNTAPAVALTAMMLVADILMIYAPSLPLWVGVAIAFAARNGAAYFTKWYPQYRRATYGGQTAAAGAVKS